MPKCVIDGREIEFAAGTNLIEVAKSAGIDIPFFCYHQGLSVVAQCRMCAVEIEKMPKLQTACSTVATEGMVVKTRSERAAANQKSVMEFLLINHPLDCPICDKSGECDLQDFSFDYGDANSRYTEERRTYMDLDMGPVIKKNMNRCIHCTRCIRFGDEIAGIREMVAVNRGNNTEITTVDGKALETDYAGNYADICPTGSLTLKEFRFRKRVWYLRKTPTVCEGCSRGCNMEIHQDNEQIYRCTPRENKDINKWWLCDEGRFNFMYVNDDHRVVEPGVAGASCGDWSAALEGARATLAGKKAAVLLGSDMTNEEAKAVLEFAQANLGGAPVLHFGTPGVKTTADDADADKILKRKSKTSNLHGVEKLGVKPFDKLPAGTDAVLLVRGGRAKLPDLTGAKVVGVGVFTKKEAEKLAVVLPGQTFAEKDGTIVNFQGKEQKLKRAIRSPGACKPLGEILMSWAARKSERATTAEARV
jgi:NADH-quinone oxidoreductase subunit G